MSTTFTHTSGLDAPTGGRKFWNGTIGWLRRANWNPFAVWEDRAYVRGQLARIAADNPELIDDIGLTRADIAAEVAKPVWRA